jgi:N-acetylglutamate synthase-like GNAT family acetyltransferase
VSRRSSFFIVEDAEGEIVGSVCYRLDGRTAVHLDGIAVSQALKGRGLSGAVLEDFCARMASSGVAIVRTFYFAGDFLTQHGFKLDRRFGGLVRLFDGAAADQLGE